MNPRLSLSVFVVIVWLPAMQPGVVNAAEKLLIPITIQNYTYYAELEENTSLTKKISGIVKSADASHYTGKLSGIANSWVRASLIGNHWQGIASLQGTLHIIDNAGVGKALGGARPDPSLKLLSTPAEAFNQELGSCAAIPGPDNRILDQVNSKQTPLANTQDPPTASVAFPDLCSQTINGVCLIAELEFAFDSLFQSAFGAFAASQAISLINMAEGYYVNDLGIAFEAITAELIETTVFSSTNEWIRKAYILAK